MPENNFPKLHNATWPGIVGKGPDSEPPIHFDKMLKMTAAAEVDGVKFDGVDLGFSIHISILILRTMKLKNLLIKLARLNLKIGSLVAPIWGGPAMGTQRTT